MEILNRLVDWKRGNVHPRSSTWPTFRDAFLRANKQCVCCRTKSGLEVHHKKPYHLYPELELDVNNVMTLCRRCHLLFGHLCDWSSWNPDVEKDVPLYTQKIRNRKYEK